MPFALRAGFCLKGKIYMAITSAARDVMTDLINNYEYTDKSAQIIDAESILRFIETKYDNKEISYLKNILIPAIENLDDRNMFHM